MWIFRPKKSSKNEAVFNHPCWSNLLDDLRVDGRHTVDLVGPDDRQVPHADLLHVTLLHDTEGRDDGAVAVPGGKQNM